MFGREFSRLTNSERYLCTVDNILTEGYRATVDYGSDSEVNLDGNNLII